MSQERRLIAPAFLAFLLALAAYLLPGCASRAARPEVPVVNAELPERRIITWGTVTDLATGETESWKACRSEPSGEPCEPGTF